MMNVVIDRLMAAVNAHDLDGLSALFHREYDSRQPAHPGRAFAGRSQVRANWEAMFDGVPDFRAELGRTVQDGDTTWCEWAWLGTRTDDQPFEMRGVALFRISGDVIVAGSLYMEAVEVEPVDIAQAVEGLSGHRPARAPDDESSNPG
jgi:ketosteroid isomerase-like protein